METKLLKSKSGADIAQAAELLKAGQVVAIPTETVYGLAANALKDSAVQAIYAAKGRPQDNPLIAHISSMDQLTQLWTSVPKSAKTLAEHFWPGPLTMCYYKTDSVPYATTAGLETVGVRMPSHAGARAIIDACGFPLAAPSANASGRPSPTTAAHVVEDMSGKIPAIVDGGRCTVGVESTFVDLTGDCPKILRPGAITEEMIAAVLGSASTDSAVTLGLAKGQVPKSPGMKYRHYAPKAPITLFEGSPQQTADELCSALKGAKPPFGVICFEEYLPMLKKLCPQRIYSLGYSWDYRAHSRRLFTLLRRFDGTTAARIFVQCPRALGANAATVNRLKRASGFKTQNCSGGKVVIGVTGRSGSGKSLFAHCAKGYSPLILDADAIYKQMLCTPCAMTRELLNQFPQLSIPIDRTALASIVFSDTKALMRLNEITHPFVAKKITELMHSSSAPLVILDVPLLFESGIDRLCTLTVGLLSPKELSLSRIMERDGIDIAAAKARLNAQPSDDFYKTHCDIVLQNTGDKAEFLQKITELIEKTQG